MRTQDLHTEERCEGRRTASLVTLSLGVVLCAFTGDLAAQDTTSTRVGKLKVIPLPVVAANPTVGWMFGLAPGATWFMGDPATTSMSSALGSAIYTTKKQWIFTLKGNTFLEGDRWNLLSDLRFFITSQPTYGLGTGPQSAKPIANGFIEFTDDPYAPITTAQLMAFNYVRFHQTLLKRYRDTRLFAGLGYHLDVHSAIDDPLLKLDTVPPQVTSHYSYQTSRDLPVDGYTLSGVSLNLLFDSRDNATNPYKGRYAFANIRLNPTWLGSEAGSSILWLEYRDYLHLDPDRPRHLIGFWTYGWFVTGGDVPYLDLPAVGWDQFGRSGRAYTQGRFRGEDLVYGEVEYRVPLQREKETWGAVAFLNATTAANRDGKIDLFEYLDPGYGVGLRIMIDKQARTNLNLDYAWGNYGAQGFYLGLNEVF